jgi:hypothetical protein
MWRVLTTAGAILLLLAHCDVAFAQVSAPPGMGATSPLGSSLSSQPSMPGGIPLGATELDSGGLSCSGTSTTVGSSSNFDGGGMASTATGCTSGASGSPGAATSGTGSTSGSARGAVPLGSTELGTPGESPAVPSTACSEISSGLSANGC